MPRLLEPTGVPAAEQWRLYPPVSREASGHANDQPALLLAQDSSKTNKADG